jgi:hypothetical protein
MPGAEGRPRWHVTSPEVPTQPNTRPVYPDLKNPFDLSHKTLRPTAEKMFQSLGIQGFGLADADPYGRHGLDASQGGIANASIYRAMTDILGGDKALVNQVLQRHGYDGITHFGGGRTYGDQHRVAIAFSPDQVYPSFGVDAWQQHMQNQSSQPPPNLPDLLPQMLQKKPGE